MQWGKMLQSVAADYDALGRPLKQQRLDTTQALDDEATAMIGLLEKYDQQERQLLLLTQQTQVLLSNQQFVTPDQLFGLAHQQQDLVNQQAQRRREFEQFIMVQQEKRRKGRRPLYDGLELEGMVKSYDNQKYFGYLKSIDVPNDIYFRVPPGKVTPEYGMRATFKLRMAKEGKFNAYNTEVHGHNEEFKAKVEADSVETPPPFHVDEGVLTAQVHQMHILQHVQEIHKGMMAQHNQQQALIQSEEAQRAAEIQEREVDKEEKKKQPGFRVGLCGDFQTGRCTRGDKCRFTHQLKDKGYCGDFQKGRCERGASCKYRHELAPYGS